MLLSGILRDVCSGNIWDQIRVHLSQNRMKSYFYDLKRAALYALKRI